MKFKYSDTANMIRVFSMKLILSPFLFPWSFKIRGSLRFPGLNLQGLDFQFASLAPQSLRLKRLKFKIDHSCGYESIFEWQNFSRYSSSIHSIVTCTWNLSISDPMVLFRNEWVSIPFILMITSFGFTPLFSAGPWLVLSYAIVDMKMVTLNWLHHLEIDQDSWYLYILWFYYSFFGAEVE